MNTKEKVGRNVKEFIQWYLEKDGTGRAAIACLLIANIDENKLDSIRLKFESAKTYMEFSKSKIQ